MVVPDHPPGDPRAVNLQDFPLRLRLPGQYVSHLAKWMEPEPGHQEYLLTACGLTAHPSNLRTPLIPRKCDMCLQALIRNE